LIGQRVFIVGCPRSGTTLLQGLLAGHSEILSLPETHFFSLAYPRNRLKRLLTWPALNVRRVLPALVEEIGHPELADAAAVGLWERRFERPFVRSLDALAERAGKSVWVEKTPRHLHFTRVIERRVPRARFIHLLRNGVDVVASLRRASTKHADAWGGARSLRECVRRWNRDVAISLACRRRPEHLLVRYERLVADPEQELRRLCSFLGITFEESMLAHERAYDRIVRPSEAWKANNASPVGSRPRTPAAVLENDELHWVRARLRSLPSLTGTGAES